MDNKINIKGGDRNARADIDSYIVHDESGDYVQLYGSVVHEEVIPQAKTKDLQLYDSLFNPSKTYLFSPRLSEHPETFEYLKGNKEKYYKKLVDDLSYIFYNLSEESGVLVNSFIKPKPFQTGRKNRSFQLKDENTYFKVKTMIHRETSPSQLSIPEFTSDSSLIQDKNEHKLYTDDFSVIYIQNTKKVIGGDIPLEKLRAQIYRNLYKYLKLNLQNTIEYEFS